MKNKKTNPPRRAVALHYDGKNAPRVTAKGRGLVADKILEVAQEHHIPLRHDTPLVDLLSRLELGDRIPEKLYKAVAQVIAYAYFISGKLPPLATDSTHPHPALGATKKRSTGNP